MLFEDLIARAAEPSLQRLVGRSAVSVLGSLDPALLHAGPMSELLLGLRPAHVLLLDKSTRSEIVDLMRPVEARELAGLLRLAGDPFVALKAVDLRKGSRKAQTFLDYFKVSEPESIVEDEKPTTIEVEPTHGLFAHQRRAAEKVLEELRSEPGRVLLHMPTGSGKTRTAMNVVATLLSESEPSLVVWLAHSEELCEQAVEEFSKAWTSLGNRPIRAVRWWGNHELTIDDLNDCFVVAGLSKIYSSATQTTELIGALAGRVRLIVMDEAHQAIAPTYQFILNILSGAGSPTPLLGLTATPGRSWNDLDADEQLANFFYKRRVVLDVDGYSSPIDFLVDEGYLANTEFESLFYRSGVELSARDLADIETGLDIPQRILNRLAEDEQRNLRIIQQVETMVRRHDRLIVFASTVFHAQLLATILQARGNWARCVTGETDRSERRRIIQQFRQSSNEPRVLVNYGVLTTGFDAPKTSGCLIARPTKSLVLYSQMVGRAIRGRRAGGNDSAEVATVVDTQLPGFRSLTEAFQNWEDVW